MPKKLSQRRMYVKIAERALGHALPDGVVIHHVDEDRTNDRPDNLVILQNAGEHKRLHKRLRTLRAGGNPWTQQLCGTCKLVKDYDEFSTNNSQSTGRAHTCAPCAARYQFTRIGKIPLTPAQRSERNRALANRRWEAYRAAL